MICTLDTPCSQLYVYDRTSTHVVLTCVAAAHHHVVGTPPTDPDRSLSLPGCPVRKEVTMETDWPSMREMRQYRVPGETVAGRKSTAHQMLAAGAFKRNQKASR